MHRARLRRPPRGVRRPAADRGARVRGGAPPAHRPPRRGAPGRTSRWTGPSRRASSSRADGAESVVRRALGHPAEPAAASTAIAIRGYAPDPVGAPDVQVIATTEQRWPAYAWSFPLGDGRANVGYGELVSSGVTRGGLLAGLDALLPGVEPDRAARPPAAAVHRTAAAAGRAGAARRGRRLADQPAHRRGHLLRRPVRRARRRGRRARARGGARLPPGAAPAAGPAPAALVGRVLGQPVAAGDGRRVPRGRRPTSGCSTTSSAWGWPTGCSPARTLAAARSATCELCDESSPGRSRHRP